jgi:predicted Zn-dependent peptidase
MSCSFGIYVGAGTRDERADARGAAHFIEHMLFKGTETRTAFEIANEMDKLGANCNAYTSKSNTVFYVTGLGRFLPRYMDILGDMLFNSAFAEENMKLERGVVLEEIKMYDDEGDSVCADVLSKKYFGKNPLAHPILGTAASVKALDAVKIRAFMNAHYRPQNICLSYVGGMDEDEFTALCETYFERPFCEKKYIGTYKKTIYRETKTNAVYAVKCDKPFEQSNVIIRFPSFPVSDKRTDPLNTMSYMLGGGMSSRLFQKVREEKGLVYDVYSSVIALKGAGFFEIGFACAPEKAADATKAVRETLDDIFRDGFTEEEFDKIKIQRETSAVLGEESTFDEMRIMGKNYLLTGRLVTYRKLFAELEKMTLPEVQTVFRDVVDYGKAALCYVGKPQEADLRKLFTEGI